MAELNELENKLKNVMRELKECVELSIAIRAESAEARPRIDKYWQLFLSHFLEYVRKREKESGQELLKGISLTKLLKFW